MDTYFDMIPSELILIIMTYLKGESIRISYINTIHDGLYKAFMDNVIKGFYAIEDIFNEVKSDFHKLNLIYNSPTYYNWRTLYSLMDTKGNLINEESLDSIIAKIYDMKIYCICAYGIHYCIIDHFFIIYTDGLNYYYIERNDQCSQRIKYILFDTVKELFLYLRSEILDFMFMQQGYEVGSIKSILPKAKVINGVSRNKWMKENKWELYPKFMYINFNKN